MTTLVRPHKQNVIQLLPPVSISVDPSSNSQLHPMKPVRMSMFGSFHLEGPNGENLTPRGQKARALLALVALAKRGQRSRLWLCSKLWSDKPTEQAYASLRQALTEIRKALGDYSTVLMQTDQFNVTLVLDRMLVDAIELRQAITESSFNLIHLETLQEEFLEGLNVGDEEFEEWLMIERSRWSDVKDQLEQERLEAPAMWQASHRHLRLATAS